MKHIMENWTRYLKEGKDDIPDLSLKDMVKTAINDYNESNMRKILPGEAQKVLDYARKEIASLPPMQAAEKLKKALKSREYLKWKYLWITGEDTS